jgi:hypothetical protein
MVYAHDVFEKMKSLIGGLCGDAVLLHNASLPL